MITTVETREDALRRLLQVARESGVRLLRDDSGEMWATSVSDPDWLHKVEPDSCGCRGFAMHRRCRHVAALHAPLGWLDPEPTPPAVAAAPDTCGECSGDCCRCQASCLTTFIVLCSLSYCKYGTIDMRVETGAENVQRTGRNR